MFEKIIENQHKLDQKKFYKIFKDHLEKNNLRPTIFFEPESGDLKKHKPYIYYNKMSRDEASEHLVNVTLEEIYTRYQKFLNENKIKIKLTENDLKNLFKNQKYEKYKVIKADQLWYTFANHPELSLQNEIDWEYYFDDIKNNITKLTKKSWENFNNIKFFKNIHRVFIADYFSSINKKEIEAFSEICNLCDCLFRINGRSFSDTGSWIKGKLKFQTEFEKIKKSQIYLKHYFMTPVYSQIQNSSNILIDIHVSYRLTLGSLNNSREDKKYLTEIVLPNAAEKSELEKIGINPDLKKQFFLNFLNSNNIKIEN